MLGNQRVLEEGNAAQEDWITCALGKKREMPALNSPQNAKYDI